MMNKVFLYLYPIYEYAQGFIFQDDKLYDEWNIKRPFPILNMAIDERYRKKGYQVVFALYKDKNIYGIIPKKEDKIIYTDITFLESSAYNSDGSKKYNFQPKYSNEELLLSKLGTVEELVIGGYHFSDCVKRVGEASLKMGINTLVDLDLTDLFFTLYKHDDYFKIDSYDAKRYKEYWLGKLESLDGRKEYMEKQFQKMYGSPIYGFNYESNQIKR